MIGDLVRVAGEVATVLLFGWLLGIGWQRRLRRPRHGQVAPLAVVVALAAAAIALTDAVGTGRELRGAHRTAIAARPGLTYCFAETGVANRVGFVDWLRARLPLHATYGLAFAPQPDQWCLTLALLPRVPQFGNDDPRWLITWGVTPPAVGVLIARRDPSVRVYAPGFALVRLP